MNQEVVDRLLASGTDQEEYFKTTYTKMKILDIICLVLSFWCYIIIRGGKSFLYFIILNEYDFLKK